VSAARLAAAAKRHAITGVMGYSERAGGSYLAVHATPLGRIGALRDRLQRDGREAVHRRREAPAAAGGRRLHGD